MYKPIEEMSFNIYAKPEKDMGHLQFLTIIIRFVLYLSSILIIFSQFWSYHLLYFLYGSHWVNDSTILILQCYSVYVLLMGINGQLEVYVMARASQSQMKIINGILTSSSVLFLGALFYFM